MRRLCSARARRLRAGVLRKHRRHLRFRVPRTVADAWQTRGAGLDRRGVSQGVLRRRLRGHRRSETRPQPGPGNGPVGRPLLAPLGKFFGRSAPLAVHLSRRSRGASATTAPSSPPRWAFATGFSSRLSIPPTPRPSAPLPATTKAMRGRWSFPAASRSTSASRSRRASATTASKRSITTATTTGTSR